MNFQPVFIVIGALLILLAALMMPPIILALLLDENAISFIIAAIITSFFGALFYLSAKDNKSTDSQSARQAFAMIVFAWLSVGIFSSLPFIIAMPEISITNAFFEAFSGITTTGATVFNGLDYMDKSILLWRSTLQWIGGIGFVVMAIIILPTLQIGGMQLFRIELFEGMEKDSPRTSQIGVSIISLYLILTSGCALAYYLAGMSLFDAINHSMTTVATGGYSTHDQSFLYFRSYKIELIAVFFMIAGSLPFITLIHSLRGQFLSILFDKQIRLFFFLLPLFIIIMFFYLILGETNFTIPQALRATLFNITSIFTGTGYASQPFDTWGYPALAFFFFLMFLGGCAGSTSCGIKLFRFQVLFNILQNHVRSAIQPYGVFIAKYNGRPLTDPIINSVMSFMVCFFLFYVLCTVLLAAHGLDFLTSLSTAAAALANVGPALGEVTGPSSNYALLPETAKWILIVSMFLGRLDIITVLVLFSPRFWKD